MELRKTKLDPKLEDEILNRNSPEEFKEWYDNRREPSLAEMKKKIPIKYLSSFIDWGKVKKVYNDGIDMYVAECGEGNFLRSKLILKSRDIKEEDLEERLPRLVLDTYGSFEKYEGFGKSLHKIGDKLQKLVDETRWSVVESVMIKKLVAYPLINCCKAESEIISEYCKKINPH
ncbi:hypothetical protein HYX19_04670 [Candidatus Woesearchaeota archaeon]|nr:hypothetical protein [Candidatus Woesearchaeota archaeon]